MKDLELRTLILQKYYDAREQEDFIPVNNEFFGNEIPIDTILRISKQLEDEELIDLKPFYGNDKMLAARGRINSKGVNLIEDASRRDTSTQNFKKPYVFISYQTAQKSHAGKIKAFFEEFSIESFLAHEDIIVSHEWRTRILEEIGKADIFVCLLSEEYYKSNWCVQESGIAAFRDMTILPLSIDGRIPEGFISKYQSVMLKNGEVGYREILDCLIKHNFDLGIQKLLEMIGKSGSFRTAERNLELILPYLNQLSEEQAKRLLYFIRKNDQIHYAKLCIGIYIPRILEKHGYLLSSEDLVFLQNLIDKK